MSRVDEAVEILLVEDSAADAELTVRALKKHGMVNELTWLKDGAEALDFLFATGAHAGRDTSPRPRVLLLDLHLPRLSGLEVLRQLKGDERTRAIPVVVLTSSRESADVKECHALGVDSCITKPVSFDELVAATGQLGLSWLLLGRTPGV